MSCEDAKAGCRSRQRRTWAIYEYTTSGTSHYLDETQSEESSASESESENDRGESDSSGDDGSDFSKEQAQEVFDDFMVSLPTLEHKTLAVLLMHSFKDRQKMGSRDAAKEAVSITRFNEKTVRKYNKDFFNNRGKFPETRQGKYERHCLHKDENIRLEASLWLRENSCKKGELNMIAQSFCQWVSDCLLPSHDLSPSYPRSISLRTAIRWIRQLGFRPTSHEKGAYVDGHERQDVVASRGDFL